MQGSDWRRRSADVACRLLVDSNFRVIAASDGQALPTERISLLLEGRRSGFHQDRAGELVALHATPGVRDVQRPRLVRRDPKLAVTRAINAPQR
jgi:hypothetical protein